MSKDIEDVRTRLAIIRKLIHDTGKALERAQDMTDEMWELVLDTEESVYIIEANMSEEEDEG